MATTKMMFLMAAAMAFLQIATAEDKTMCVPQNCSIPNIVAPVCGSDSETYMNEYQLECYRKHCYPDLRLVKKAACNSQCSLGRPCLAHLNIDPVCGSDGNVYVNRDVFTCHKRACVPGMHVTESGLNVLERRTCTCEYAVECNVPRFMATVCGSNGRTYVNKHELLCHQRDCYPDLHIVNRGPCFYSVTHNPFDPFGSLSGTK